MLHWKEFSAWITIDGKEAVEYNVETLEDEKTVTCWIASELGKKFSIDWKNSYFPQDVAGYVKVDGTTCGSKVSLYSNHFKEDIISQTGVSDGTTLRPFVFSALELTDDDDVLSGSASLSLQDLGLIQLTIIPVHATDTNEPLFISSLSNHKVHERSKKAITQQITLAEPEILDRPPRVLNVRRTGPDVVKFCFKYRPIDVLRANGIAPQLKRKASADPAPPRTQTPDDSEGLAELEEAKVLRKKLRALEAKIDKRDKKPRIKPENGAVIDLTQDNSRSKRVKLEGKRPFITGEVIDLT
ncbi:hypothetical protein MVEN_00829000 [Mycena venus]|uniref:DUF7918 domain-containing protein n=1 Tax=Mycena venus TaxID=2733690 RepID=A0A8H6YGH4_9AGAR|nr:hypothetical protein MVEN_00829000 [Mycena venus]